MNESLTVLKAIVAVVSILTDTEPTSVSISKPIATLGPGKPGVDTDSILGGRRRRESILPVVPQPTPKTPITIQK